MPEPEQRELSPVEILLDPYNPRLRADEEGSDQAQLRKIILDRFKAEELAESIAESGFLHFDPLVGCEREGRVYVAEGNRRIAVLQLLLDPELAPPPVRAKWQGFRDRLIESPAKKSSIERVPIKVYLDCDDETLATYKGFRHVTGSLKWPALEKAGFIADLVNRGWDYSEIASRLGSYPKHVERHFIAFQLTEQATDLDLPGATMMKSRFGVLLRALQTPGIRDFVGVDFPGESEVSRTPVPAAKEEDFAAFVLWTFGNEDRSPVVRDSRQLSHWGEILSSPEAVRYLRLTSRPEFERAWFKSGGQGRSLQDSLFSAADQLQEAVPLVSEFDDDADVTYAVGQVARFFGQIVRHFPDVLENYGLALTDDD